MADLFLSYSRDDKQLVSALDAELRKHDLDVWVDWEDIPPNAKWRNEIGDAVSAADAVVFVLTPNSLASHECSVELEAAFDQNKRVITVMGAEPDGVPVPERIAALNWIPATPADDLRSAVSKLVDALRTDLEWVHFHTRLLVRANEWESRGRDRSYLLTGSDLRQAEAELAAGETRQPRPTPLQREYLATGRHAAERRQRQLLGGVSLALVLAVGLAVFALIQRSDAIHQKTQALSRELAANAALNQQRDPELSLLLAIAAARTSPTAEAASVLRRALVLSPLRATLRPTDFAGRAVIAPDGRHAVTVGRTTRLWDVTRTRRALSVKGTSGSEPPAAFTPDGRQAVIGAAGGALSVRDAASGHVLRTLDAGVPALDAVAVGPDSKTVAVAGSGRIGLAAMRGSSSAGQLSEAPHDVNRLSFLDGGRLLAAVSGGGRQLAIWDTNSRQRVFTAGGDSIDVNADGNLVASKAGNNQISIRRRAGGKTTTIGDPAGIYLLRLTPDGRTVLTADFDLAVRVWRVSDGRLMQTLRGVSGGSVDDIAVTPDSSQVIAVSNEGSAHVWRISDPGSVFARHALGLTSTPSGSALLLQTGHSLEVRRFGAAGGARIASTPAVLQSDAQISQNGRTVLGKDSNETVRVWRVGSSAAPHALPVTNGDIAPLALSPDGRTVASVDSRGRLAVWDSSSGRRTELGAAGQGADEVAFSSDSKQLVTAAAGSAAPVRVWRTGGGRPHTVARRAVTDPTFSPDGRTLLLVRSAPDLHRPGEGRVVRASDGHAASRVMSAPGMSGARFSPDGRLIVSSGEDGFARVWTKKGAPLSALQNGDAVFGSFSPDSHYVLTTSNDGFARVWEATTGQRLLEAELSFENGAAGFVSGGRAFAAIGRDGSARLFQCEVCRPLPDLLKLADRRVTRRLSAGERNRYLRATVTP